MLKILRDFTRKLNVSITCTHWVTGIEKFIICPFPLDQIVFLRSHCTYTISPLIGYDNFIVWFPSRSTRHIFFTNTYYCSWVMYRMTSLWIRLHCCWISVDQTSSSNLVFGGTIPVDVGRRRSKVHYPRASQLSWLALNYPDSAVSRLLSVNLPSLTRMLKHSQNTFLVSISFSFPLRFYQRGFVFTLQALNLKNCMKKVLWVIVDYE